MEQINNGPDLEADHKVEVLSVAMDEITKSIDKFIDGVKTDNDETNLLSTVLLFEAVLGIFILQWCVKYKITEAQCMDLLRHVSFRTMDQVKEVVTQRIAQTVEEAVKNNNT